MRTIAATFATPAAADDARAGLLEASVPPDAISVAAAVVAESDESPIDRPATIVAVLVDGNAPTVRDVLQRAGGHVVADRQLDV
jgi:hypothetical protein